MSLSNIYKLEITQETVQLIAELSKPGHDDDLREELEEAPKVNIYFPF